MAKKILISNVLPKEALDLIPKEITVDYNSADAPLPKAELLARLKGKDGLVCHIVSAIDEEVLAAAPTAFGRNASEHCLVFSNSSGARSSPIHRSIT